MEGIRKKRILIADDSEMNREILIDMLGDEYDVLEATDGEEAVKQLAQWGVEIDLVLLDIVMPKMDGFEVLSVMNREGWIKDIPVIIISSETLPDIVERAYELGAVDFISRPFDQSIVHRRTTNTILLYAKQRKLTNMVAEQIYEKEKQSGLMIDILSHIVEFRNGESGLHVRHVHVLTELLLNRLVQITDRYPLTKQQMNIIATASALHDIGKIAIPGEIINKPGRLTDEEFAIMKSHSAIGSEMLNSLPAYQDEPLVRVGYEIARWHHERWDGRGYPDGLKGDEIPIGAQIVALADVYDALTSERVYKKAFSHEKAVEMILDGQCGAFNPLLMDCLRSLAEELPEQLRLATAQEDGGREMRVIAEEVQRHEELSVSNRTLQMLEHERLKARFFADVSEELQFEYTVSPGMLTLSGVSAAKLGLPEMVMNPLTNERILSLIGRDGMEALSSAIHAAGPEKPVVTHECRLDIDGRPRRMRVVCRVLWSDAKPTRYTGVIGKAIDIRDEQEHPDALEWMASHDSLTGLLNHSSAKALIQERIGLRPDAKYVLLIFDMDGFKSINDVRGHLFGDKVLAYMAERLRQSVRSGDIVARVGGDEFLIFLEYKESEGPAVQRLFRHLTCRFEDQEIRVSMGAARTEELGTDYERLFHAADQALCAVKELGGNQVCYYNKNMKDMLSAVSAIDESSPSIRRERREE
ncbi:MAG: diguanylate cyclase [Christensenellaceae bacterium]|nr:diguanylate cyclase [Christensenellaceae bacterium]